MKCQVMGNQIKEEKFEICIKSVYRYERRKGRKEKLVKSFLEKKMEILLVNFKFLCLEKIF